MPPTMLISSLEHIRRKVRLLSVLYGMGIVLASVVGLVLGIILVDYLLNLMAWPRVVIMLGAAGVLAYVIWQWVLRPLVARLTINDIAGRVETAFPQFDDRLRSTVDFLAQRDLPGSEAMKQRVVSETATLAGHIDLQRAVVARPAYLSMAGGVGAILLAIVLAVLVNQTYLQIALARLVTPFNGTAWPKKVQIGVLGAPQTRVPVGERLDIRMKLTRGDRQSMRAIVYYQYDDGPVQQEFMARGADGTYSSSLDARIESNNPAARLKIWMRSGDDRVDLPPITVVPRLAIQSVQALVTPPPYVGDRNTTTIDLTQAPAVVAAGSELTLRVTFNKPLAEGKPVQIVPVTDEMPLPPAQWRQESPFTVLGTWVARSSLRFHIRGIDTDRFQNNALEEFELIVRPDQSPSVQIEQPRRNEERTAVSVVPLRGLAEDDYGIEWLKLIVERVNDKRQWEIPLVESGQPSGSVGWSRAEGTGDRLRFRADYQWDLGRLADANLQPGEVLEYYLLVKDNYALEGRFHEPVPSGRLRITIISQDELIGRVIDELRQVRNQVADVKNSQDRLRQETGVLREETRDKPELDAADHSAAERLTNQQATAAAQAKTLAGKVDQVQQRLDENKSPSQELRDLARDVKNDLNQAAENPMKEATNELSTANQARADQQKRDESLEKAQASQQQASEQLARALERMNHIGSLEQTIAAIRNLLAEQQKISAQTREIGKDNLGKTPEQMKPEDRQRLNQNADEQQKLAEQTNKALEQMQKLAEQMKRSDPSSAEAMEKAARTGQQQQVSPNQQKASQQARQNQQSGAQAAQKQAELGLELVLNELREAEKRKLAELSRKLEELQNQIANLIRRQAGHNLDNLANQGPQRVAQVDPLELAELMNKAERDQGALPPIPSPDQLAPAQEQSERNARDIAKTAESVPNGAEPAAHLTRAAGRMERAIISLRERKLPDAYEPPQVEALAALEAAKRIVDEQKDKVDEQIEEKDKEAIRQKFARIKDEQVKLNAETARIEGTRDPQGALARQETMRLAQLPGEQGKLAEETDAISQDLAAIGSTVYIWANKDIVDSMNDVKADLGKGFSGVPTQAEQQRVVEQLDAMIRNLAIKPKESKFAQDAGGGGGGGQQGPRLPTEAELRLLQDLQRSVNRNTQVVDAQPQKDRERLAALGERQGALRRLLDETLQKASGGEMKLGPEPDNRDQLPEEANVEDVENQELDRDLLEGVPAEKHSETKAELIGDRMARSRQRLAINNDPGQTTQIIQQRIVEDFDFLIEQAREQQAQARNSNQNRNNQRRNASQPQPGDAEAQNQGQQPGQPQPNRGNRPASESRLPGPGNNNADLSREIEEKLAEWGQLSPRLRDAVLDIKDEKIVAEYQKLVEEYYRAVSTKANER